MKIFAKALPSHHPPSVGCMVAYTSFVTIRKTGKLIPSGRLRIKRLNKVHHYEQMVEAGLQPFVANLMPCCEGMGNAIVESKNFKMMEEKRQEILFGTKKAVAFYVYPTYTVQSSHLYKEDAAEYHTFLRWEEDNGEITNAVDWVINQVCHQMDMRRDNKIAVCCMISEQPVYYCSFDLMRIICTKINVMCTSVIPLDSRNIIIPPLNQPNGEIQST